MANTLEIKKYDWENTDHTIPTLEIVWTNDSGEERRSYLQPFRGYCFQVSSNPLDGSDMGSSRADFRYRDVFKSLDEVVARHMLEGDATTALSHFCYGRKVEIPNVWGWNDRTEMFREFIKECYSWIMR